MKHYEYTYLTRQDISEEDAKKIQDDLTAFLQEKKGGIVDLLKSYKKRLAYPIKKQIIAYVNTILFRADPETAAELKKEADGIDRILRGLLVAYDPEKLKRGPRRERTRSIDRPVEEKTTADKEIPARSQETEKPVKKEPQQESALPQKKAKAELRDIEQKLDEILN